MFGPGLAQAEAFAELLTQEGVLRGLIGPREVPRLWERHLLNCAVLEEAIGEGLDVCDVGSGAGLPGVVLALARPDLRITLVEPLLRRTTFLLEAVDALGLENVEVVRARAEELHGKREFSVVTSRAVAPLERLVGWSLPLVRRGGELIAMKGSSVHEEIRGARAALIKAGGADVRVEECGQGRVESPIVVVRVRATRESALGLGTAKAVDRPGRKRPPRGRKGR